MLAAPPPRTWLLKKKSAISHRLPPNPAASLFNLELVFLFYVFINISGYFKPVPRGPIYKYELFETVTKTTALACQNFMMALVAEGFDSCPMEGFDEKRIKKILKLNWKCHVVMIFGIGKADIKGIYGERFRIDDDLVIKEI